MRLIAIRNFTHLTALVKMYKKEKKNPDSKPEISHVVPYHTQPDLDSLNCPEKNIRYSMHRGF